MKRGFYTIMSAQFFSSLADNALFVAAVELIKSGGGAEWQRAALVPMFALFYVVLAPFVGAFADAMPKGKVMFASNAIKVVGCLLMLFGLHPLLAYAVVGLGAAAYSPAKYGILTELLPASQLVKANGWIEGLTIASIILGILLGGQLVGQVVASRMLAFDLPVFETGIDTPPEAAIFVLIFIYALAAWFNTRIPHTGVEMRPMPKNPLELVPDFWTCNSRLWRDKLGPDLAGHHHPLLGRERQSALHHPGVERCRPGLQHHAGLVAEWRGGAGHRRRRDGGLAAHAAGHGHQRDADGHRHGPAGDPDEFHHQRLGGRPVPDPAGRPGWFPRRADERAAAAPRPQPDGGGPLDRRAELQRAGLHPGPGRLLQPVGGHGPVRVRRDHRLRRGGGRLHVDHPALAQEQLRAVTATKSNTC